MKKWLLAISLSALAAVPVLAANPLYWHDVRSIARGEGGYYFASLGKAPSTPFDSLLVIYCYAGFSVPTFGFKRSPNLGVTFSESLAVMQGYPYGGDWPHNRFTAVAHDARGIHVVLGDGDSYPPYYQGVYYLRSSDGGTSWTSPFTVPITNPSAANHPALAMDDYGFTVFWDDYYHVYCRRYWNSTGWESTDHMVDGGDVRSGPQAISIAFLGNGAPIHKLYVVYRTATSSTWGVGCRSSMNYGQSWNTEVLNTPANIGYYPSPALTGRNGVDNVYVVYEVQWSGVGSGARVYCSQVGPGHTPAALTADIAGTFDQQVPRITIGTGDTLYAVWQDGRTTYNEIYFDRSGDGGQTWIQKPQNNQLISRPDPNDPLQAYPCAVPDVFADGIHQVVVWDSINSTNGRLMYRKRSLDTKAPSAPTGLQVVWLNVVELYWTGVSDAAGYNVYRAPGTMPPFAFQKISPQPVIGTVYYDFSASPTGCYTYYVTAVDAGENESGSSSYAYYYGCSIGGQLASVDAGTPAPSSNTVRRAGYYTWGGTPDSTVDYDPDSLVYRFTSLAPDSFYLLGVEYFGGDSSRGRQQSLNIDGVQVHGASLLPGTPSRMVYLVPKRTYQDSAITVSLVKNQGPNAVVAQLWLYQAHFPGGGPQSAGVVDLKGAECQLYPASPNPTTSFVQFEYALASSRRVALAVYDVTGRQVRILVDREDQPGLYRLVWDGKNEEGRRVKSGVYFVRLQAGKYAATQKVVLVR